MGKIYLGNERIGEIRKNKQGSLMRIIEYNNANDILVQFGDGKPVHTNYINFLKGHVKNVYDKTVCGVGFLGEGEFKAFKEKDNTECYKIWRGMLKRCYDIKVHEKNPLYKDCNVDERWHNFQNFHAWFNENYYDINGETMCLDKDILVKGNKIYSPETCIFVPDRINKLFTRSESTRGKCPIGVTWKESHHKFTAQCNVNGKRKYLGIFDTSEEAYQTYKLYKEKIIKDVANEYKHLIPGKLYNAMITYEVSIND